MLNAKEKFVVKSEFVVEVSISYPFSLFLNPLSFLPVDKVKIPSLSDIVFHWFSTLKKIRMLYLLIDFRGFAFFRDDFCHLS